MTRPIPQAAVDFVKRWEGVRLEPYRDSAGFWTVGTGHLVSRSPLAPKPAAITMEENDRLLAEDLAFTAASVERSTPGLTDDQFAACISLAFNIGVTAFHQSTVARRIRAGDMAGAAKAFAFWNKAGGKVVKGLVNRRAAEAELFSKDA